MTRIQPIPLHSTLALFEAASAKVEAQRIKLAGIKEDDPQRSREESLLRSMINNASAARLLVSIGQRSMTDRKGLVERAFDLAQDGSCASTADIRRRLKIELFSSREIEGHLLSTRLRAQLTHLCRQATGST